LVLLQSAPSGAGGKLITPFSQQPTETSETGSAASGSPLYFGAEAQQQLARIRSRYGSG